MAEPECRELSGVSIGNQSGSTDKSTADMLLYAQEGAAKDKKATPHRLAVRRKLKIVS